MQQLVAENAYLRDENADLRRQIYSMRVSYGGRDPSSAGPLPPPPTDQSKTTTGIWPEVKTEAAPYGGVYSAPGSAIVSSPRVPGSSHARTQSHPGEFVRVSSQNILLRSWRVCGVAFAFRARAETFQNADLYRIQPQSQALHHTHHHCTNSGQSSEMTSGAPIQCDTSHHKEDQVRARPEVG